MVNSPPSATSASAVVIVCCAFFPVWARNIKFLQLAFNRVQKFMTKFWLRNIWSAHRPVPPSGIRERLEVLAQLFRGLQGITHRGETASGRRRVVLVFLLLVHV